MHPRELQIKNYTYQLPDDRIARYPLTERDTSKLLIYKNEVISDDVYRNLATHIPPGALMVFNQTRVVNARLLFQKQSGSIIEVFCLAPHSSYASVQAAMTQRGKVLWECMIGGASKWKPGMVLQLHHTGPAFTLCAKIMERNPSGYILLLEWDDLQLTFAEVLHHAGKVPLPPYLHRDAEAGDKAAYQTLFAKDEGSVAAPTAGLHFTPYIMDSLSNKNISTAFVTLHVGAGTFKPVKSETMDTHDMHAEWIDISPALIRAVQEKLSSRIVAVGTTSLRTLESLYWIGNKIAAGQVPDFTGIAVSQWDPYHDTQHVSAQDALTALLKHLSDNGIDRLVTRTQILIAPGYSFRIINGLVTNFHQPQSTLLLLVAALIGDQWRRIYDHALHNNYRFLSYGDGSLLWRHDIQA